MIYFADKYQEISGCLKERFRKTESKKWNIRTTCLEFIVQLGHLNYVIYKNCCDLPCPFIKDTENISDEICDLLFQTFNLANCINLNLSEELVKTSLNLKKEMMNRSEIIIFIIHHIGNLCDCVLILEGFKERSNIDNQALINRAKDNIITIYIYLFDLAKMLNIQLDSSFEKMLSDTDNYLRTYEQKQNYY